ncbi:hypothetical protein Ancab_030100 [Ancistrocladus abbreviatus]
MRETPHQRASLMIRGRSSRKNPFDSPINCGSPWLLQLANELFRVVKIYSCIWGKACHSHAVPPKSENDIEVKFLSKRQFSFCFKLNILILSLLGWIQNEGMQTSYCFLNIHLRLLPCSSMETNAREMKDCFLLKKV